jgi:hypothetical protein
MRVLQRVIFPFAAPAQPVDVVITAPERGVYALVHVESKGMHAQVLADAERGLQAYLRENPSAPASSASLRALIENMARATLGKRDANPEVAVVWMHDDDAFVATIGACAVVRCANGRIDPLHSLDTLAHANPQSGMGRTAHWIVVRMLGKNHDDLVAGLTEQQTSFEPGDILMLLSPRIATCVVEFGMRPPTPLADLEALADWLETLVEVDAARPEDAVGALVLLQREP